MTQQSNDQSGFPRWGYYLTYGPNPKKPGTILAVISDGTPQKGHSPVTVCDTGVFETEEQMRQWYKAGLALEPWIPRN